MKPVARPPALLAVLFAGALALPPRAVGESLYRRTAFRLDGPVEKLLAADVDGDGLQDLVCGRGRGIDFYLQKRGAEFPGAMPDARIELDGVAVGWDLDRGSGSTLRVVAFTDGRRVQSIEFDPENRSFSKPRDIATEVSGFLPRGVRHLDLARDVDGDGRADLVIPGLSAYQVLFQRGDGYSDRLVVNLDARLESKLPDEKQLTERSGQTLTLPALDLRDTNGDGRVDLVSRTEERLDVYLAAATGKLPEKPSYGVDLEAIRKRVGEWNPDKLDLSNLAGALAWTFQSDLVDVDSDGVDDLLLREGGKVSIFSGHTTGIDLRRPRQVLKSGGNVLTAVLHDEDGDGYKDLWLVRVEDVSIGDVLFWLVAAGDVDFEAFVYRNEKSAFSRRPVRRLVVTLSFPALRSLAELGEEIESEKEKGEEIEIARASLDSSGERDDAIAIAKTAIRGYRDVPRLAANDVRILELIGYRPDRDEYVLELEDVARRIAVGNGPEASLRGREPVFELLLEGAASDARSFLVLDLDGDRIDDVLLIDERNETGVRGQIFRSRDFGNDSSAPPDE